MNYRLTSLLLTIASFLYFPLANASEIVNSPLNNKDKSILVSQKITGDRQVTVEIEVNQTKSTGESWDIDRSVIEIAPQTGTTIKAIFEKPDIALCIEYEQDPSSPMMCLQSKENHDITASCQDSYKCTFSDIYVPSGQSKWIIVDLDALENDVIGKGNCEINSKCQLGQGIINIFDIDIKASKPESKNPSTDNNDNSCSINELQANEEIEQLKADIQNLILVKADIESQIAQLGSEKTDSPAERSEVERLESEINELIERRNRLYEERKLQVDELNEWENLQYKRQRITELEQENHKLEQEQIRLALKAAQVVGTGSVGADKDLINKSPKQIKIILKKINPWITAIDLATKMKDLSNIQQEYKQVQKNIEDNNYFINANIENVPDRPYDLLIDSDRKYLAKIEQSIEILNDKIEYKQTAIERERAREETVNTDNEINIDTEKINTLDQELKQIDQNILNKEKQIEKLELLYGNKACDSSAQELDLQPNKAIWDVPQTNSSPNFPDESTPIF